MRPAVAPLNPGKRFAVLLEHTEPGKRFAVLLEHTQIGPRYFHATLRTTRITRKGFHGGTALHNPGVDGKDAENFTTEHSF